MRVETNNDRFLYNKFKNNFTYVGNKYASVLQTENEKKKDARNYVEFILKIRFSILRLKLFHLLRTEFQLFLKMDFFLSCYVKSTRHQSSCDGYIDRRR